MNAPALDVRTLSFPAGDPAWIPYIYNIPDTTLAAAAPGNTGNPRTTVDGQHTFLLTHITGTRNGGPLAPGDVRVLVRRNLDQFSSQAMDGTLIAGTGLRPYYLAAPIICTGSTDIGTDLVAGVAGTFAFQFHGIQVATRDLNLIRAAIPALFLENGYALSFYAYDVTRQYSASEREKEQVKTPAEYDLLLTELNALSTGNFSSRVSWSGDVALDDNLTPNVGYYGNAQFPGYVNPTFVPATATLTADNKDTSAAPNFIEVVWAGVRYPFGLKV